MGMSIERLKQYLGKARFSAEGDRYSALECVANLERQLLAEKKRASAQNLLIKSQEKQLTEFGKQKDSWMEAVSTLDSERKANDVLTRQLAEISATLPDDFSESKDWSFDTTPVSRIEWLKSFHASYKTEITRLELQLADGETPNESHKALVRRLDVLINGEDGAAPQASLCDIVGQVEEMAKQVQVPKGWMLVPNDPTDAMLRAFTQEKVYAYRAGVEPSVADYYRAMLAAAPQSGVKP